MEGAAARAFTGYRQVAGRFVFSQKDHDDGNETVFGEEGRWNGDDVVTLIFRQKAARRFLPSELCQFYLTDLPLPREYFEALGEAWHNDGYHSGRLLARFFRSRLFYDDAFRGTMIKSPTHLYLGLLQDLGLDAQPFPRFTQGVAAGRAVVGKHVRSFSTYGTARPAATPYHLTSGRTWRSSPFGNGPNRNHT